MKIIFMGTPEFACFSLEKIIKSSHEIVSVVTTPDRPRGRGQKLAPSAVKLKALENNIPILQPQSLRDESFIDSLINLAADLFVVVAFRILPEDVFAIPKKGAINLHASLLPAYRGAAPINRSLMNGATESGVTTFFLKEKVDTGNIILQKSIPLSEDMTAGELHDKLMIKGADLLIDTIDLIDSGNFSVKEQDDKLASPAPKIFPEDCLIDWNSAAQNIHNQIRGLDPYPGAFSFLNGIRMKLFSSQLSSRTGLQGGQVSVKDEYLEVGCYSGSVQIYEIQMMGKRKMRISDFLRGNPIPDGSFFDSSIVKE